jgi:hypothetical protein
MAKVAAYHTITPERPYGQGRSITTTMTAPRERQIQRQNWQPPM